MAHGPDTNELLRDVERANTTGMLSIWLNITNLPPLPDTLKELSIYHTPITSLPTLPSTLEKLILIETLITELPLLPSTLKKLYINPLHNLGITQLPPLPPTLVYLSCITNYSLTELPPLPSSLQKLYCGWTQITELPPLPDSLLEFGCQNTLLTELPSLPSSLTWLNCSDCPNLIIQRTEGESIQDYNKRWEEWREEQLSNTRCQSRCLAIKEELIAAAWHPDRVEQWLEMLDM